MILHAINYNGGQIWVDKFNQLSAKENGYVLMLSVWSTPIEPKLLSVIDRDTKGNYCIKARRVPNSLNHADINGETWATVFVSDCSGKVVAQSNLKAPLPNIPYVEIEESIFEITELERLMRELPVDWVGTGDYRSAEKDEKQWEKEWEEAYKVASAKKYTEEDLRKAILMAWDNTFDTKNIDEIIQSLQPKVVSIEVETEEKEYGHVDDYSKPHSFETVPITYKKDGKTLLKIKKINHATTKPTN